MVTDGQILTDEPLLPAKLKTLGDGKDGLAFAISEGYRAISIPVG
jgi:Flp pilus assembly protein CpaB